MIRPTWAAVAAAMVAAPAGAQQFGSPTLIPNTTASPQWALPHVASLSALQGVAPGAMATVVRDGYASAGDGGTATYNYSPTACSQNNGSGDGGSQVQASGGGCWIASFPNRRVPLLAFGAKGDGYDDDAPALRAAYAACTNGNFLAIDVPSTPINTYLLSSLSAAGDAVLDAGDGQKIGATVSIASGSNALTATTSIFTAAMSGGSIDVPGAGSGGGVLWATITAVNSPTSVTLNVNAPTTLSGSAVTLQIGHSNACVVEGEAVNTGFNTNIGNNGVGWGVYFRLGNGLNRPLVNVKIKSASPSFHNITLDGNGSNQTGWSGGPGGKLYTIQAEDGSPYPEGSFRLEKVHVINGYNGNAYFGAGRGATLIRDSYFLYGGQGPSDDCLVFNGYDAVMEGSGVGSCNGVGAAFLEGAQYQLTDNAFWSNYDNLALNGGAVEYFSATNTNIQLAQRHGIVEQATGPFSNTNAAGHFFANTTFDANNAGNLGGNDIQSNGSKLLSFANAAFLGNAANASGQKPVYNIGLTGSNLVRIANPTFGASPNSSGSVWQYANQILASGMNMEYSWTPTFTGATITGSATYSFVSGTWSRNNNEVTLHINMQLSSTGGAGGSAIISGLPLWQSSATGEVGSCAWHGVSGWTGQSGYATLTGLVGQNSPTIYFYEIGSGKNATPAQVSEFAANANIQGDCVYHTDQ